MQWSKLQRTNDLPKIRRQPNKTYLCEAQWIFDICQIASISCVHVNQLNENSIQLNSVSEHIYIHIHTKGSVCEHRAVHTELSVCAIRIYTTLSNWHTQISLIESPLHFFQICWIYQRKFGQSFVRWKLLHFKLLYRSVYGHFQSKLNQMQIKKINRNLFNLFVRMCDCQWLCDFVCIVVLTWFDWIHLRIGWLLIGIGTKSNQKKKWSWNKNIGNETEIKKKMIRMNTYRNGIIFARNLLCSVMFFRFYWILCQM